MSWIFVDREKDGDSEMRSHMRRNIRSGSYPYMMHKRVSMGGETYHDGYRMGYKHGWEDHEDEMGDEMYRRRRDSLGRYA